ncbi:hypothetical protein JX265_011124 [Neoarthrinium moseri]|uniref:Uncharacterized protein n=1 Tax=Neoarthrinium moseri TaxID=1658444 RepID=A0A9P9WD93_9PEZI|nr:hypothetical protein JX265_011124 [Neoarthrinium moseri]
MATKTSTTATPAASSSTKPPVLKRSEGAATPAHARTHRPKSSPKLGVFRCIKPVWTGVEKRPQPTRRPSTAQLLQVSDPRADRYPEDSTGSTRRPVTAHMADVLHTAQVHSRRLVGENMRRAAAEAAGPSPYAAGGAGKGRDAWMGGPHGFATRRPWARFWYGGGVGDPEVAAAWDEAFGLGKGGCTCHDNLDDEEGDEEEEEEEEEEDDKEVSDDSGLRMKSKQ